MPPLHLQAARITPRVELPERFVSKPDTFTQESNFQMNDPGSRAHILSGGGIRHHAKLHRERTALQMGGSLIPLSQWSDTGHCIKTSYVRLPVGN